MDETDLQRITRILQSEAEAIAVEATALFTANWASVMWSEADLPVISQETPGAHAKLQRAQNPAEVQNLVRDGYVRLGSVIALSVFVDEPGLLANDLWWLKRMFDARSIHFPLPALTEAILQSYAQASSRALGPDDMAIVNDVIERAKSILASGNG